MEDRLCPECGSPVAANAPGELCPKCLLKIGLEGSDAGVTDSAVERTVIVEPDSAATEETIVPTQLDISGPAKVPAVGTRVRYLGDYELQSEIARGGMGVVYRARQVRLNRMVALKMILAGQFAGEADVERFHTEAEAAANLDHPGIVPIFEVGEHEGNHYFSMGLVEGGSLASMISDGPLPPREAATFVRKIAEAIQYAHDNGVIHRDLKPANVLIDPTGQPKVTDFGLAKKIEGDSGLTGTGQILGTPAYMPPEQASGKVDEVGPLADVYSLGAILYCLLTGQPPHQGTGPLETLKSVLEQDPIAPRNLNEQLPRDLESVCLKCLEKEPQNRIQSADELSKELERFLNGEPVLTRPLGVLEKCWRWGKRRPGAAAALSVVAIMLIALSASGGFEGLLLGIPVIVAGSAILAFFLHAEPALVTTAFLSAAIAIPATPSSHESAIGVYIGFVGILLLTFAISILKRRLWAVGTVFTVVLISACLLSYRSGNLNSLCFWLCAAVLLTGLAGIPARVVARWLNRELFAPALGAVLGLILGCPTSFLATRIILRPVGTHEAIIWFVVSAALTAIATVTGSVLGALGGKAKN